MTEPTQENGPAVKQPAGTDRRWAEKVAIAKAAREQGKILRAGKSMTFSSRRTHRTTQ